MIGGSSAVHESADPWTARFLSMISALSDFRPAANEEGCFRTEHGPCRYLSAMRDRSEPYCRQVHTAQRSYLLFLFLFCVEAFFKQSGVSEHKNNTCCKHRHKKDYDKQPAVIVSDCAGRYEQKQCDDDKPRKKLADCFTFSLAETSIRCN